MILMLIEQPLLPVSVLPTLAVVMVAAGLQWRLARSRRRLVARVFRRMSPMSRREGMLLRFVDDEGRRWETRFLPVRAMELRASDPVFTDGWITRSGRLSVWGLTNIRTGSLRRNRYVAVWPIVIASIAITTSLALSAM